MIERVHTAGSEHRRALYSDCGTYRYLLEISFRLTPLLVTSSDVHRPPLLPIIGLNPSTATELEDDHTIRREKDFARRWGYGGIRKANLCAFRATEPKAMLAAVDPFGPENTVDWLVETLLEIPNLARRPIPLDDFTRALLERDRELDPMPSFAVPRAAVLSKPEAAMNLAESALPRYMRPLHDAIVSGRDVVLRSGPRTPAVGLEFPHDAPMQTAEVVMPHASVMAKTDEVPRSVPLVLACWGAHGAHSRLAAQAAAIVERFGSRLYAFGVTGNRQPKHPLYLPADAAVRPLAELVP